MAEPEISLFSPSYHVEECLAAVRECLERGWTGLGYKTIEFEEAWRSYTGFPHAHFVNSCTAALHLAVALLKRRGEWADGDEVVSTPLTFVSTNHAILYERLRPVFADVDETLCLDPESVRARVGPRTRAVMFVGHGGNAGRLAEIAAFCKGKGLALILDAAHMAGTRVDGRHVGLEADAAAFSFHSVKNLPTADGGMVCFSDPALDAQARKASWLGINKDTFSRMGGHGTYKWLYDVEGLGWKYHGNSVMAALGIVALRYLDRDNSYRRQLAAWYEARLGGQKGLDLVPMPANCEPSRHLFQVMVDDRDGLMVYLNALGIFPGVHYRANTEYGMYADARGSCPRAERASARLVSLPLHVRMVLADVGRVVAAVKGFIERKADGKV